MTARARVALLIGMALVGAVAARHILRRGAAPATVDISGLTMGTTYTVKIADLDLSPPRRARIRDTIKSRLDAVDRLMSTYDSTSELSRFNRHLSSQPFPLSRATLEVFEVAQQVSRRSEGAFDVTVGPLVDAWGFGPPSRPPTPPSDSVLRQLAPVVGYELITVDTAAGTIRKSNAHTVADLSAVAKGYAVDQVAEALSAMGLDAFLVEVGGELRAKGTGPDGRPWRVGIERPQSDVRSAYMTLDLVDMAVATSGDYRNYYEVEGVRYSHIIDPRTLAPVRHSGASVTVVHPSAVWADAWATALSVLGPDRGLEIAERERIAAVFLVRRGGEFSVIETETYRRWADGS